MGWYYDPNDPAKDDPDYAVPISKGGPGGKLKRGSTVKVSPKVSKKKSGKKKR
jgi:hypothetical protein